MAEIVLREIIKAFGATPVLRGVTLEVADGEFLAILGPSGCGKSTLLRILAGLETHDSGAVVIGGRRVDALPAKARDLAMVFQSYALYPYMTVRQNIAVPLEMRRLSALQRLPLFGRLLPGVRATRDTIETDVTQVARALELSALLARRPSQLSGGQRQRVALARAMVRNPAAFLMDEPLSNLDARLRAEARAEIGALQRRLRATMVYVTHDQAEAMAMADRVAVMRQGRVLQIAAPQTLYDEPADLDVARFVGSPTINLLPASIADDGMVQVCGVALPWRAAKPGEAILGIRPEALRPATYGLSARILRIEHLGSETLLSCDVAGIPQPLVARIEPQAAAGFAPGMLLHLLPQRALLFSEDGTRLPLRAATETVLAA
jgi:multiple sugar transport system ATP-binding protein